MNSAYDMIELTKADLKVVIAVMVEHTDYAARILKDLLRELEEWENED